jgi:chromosome segregation ATPase
MAEQNSAENVEDEASRHRRERRELQSTIQQLKKSVNKNDKTRKKKIDSEIKALEDAFAKRWENFNENSTTTTEPIETSIPTQSDENPPEVRHKKPLFYLKKMLFFFSSRLMKNNNSLVKPVV